MNMKPSDYIPGPLFSQPQSQVLACKDHFSEEEKGKSSSNEGMFPF